jgi:hypothetical protein
VEGNAGAPVVHLRRAVAIATPLSFVSPLPADIEGLLAVLREDAAAGGARG